MSPRFCSKLVFQALAAVMLTASEDGETFKTLPAKIASKFGLSSRVADDLFYSRIVGKYEQIHIHRVHNFELKELTISHSNASQFHTQVPDHLCQRGRSGVSSAYACKQEQGEMGEQPQNLTLFLNPLLSYVTIQGAHPTSYLLAVFSLFAPGVDLLGKCVLQLVQTLLSNQTGARRPGQLWTTFWPSTGTGLGWSACSWLLFIFFTSATSTPHQRLSTALLKLTPLPKRWQSTADSPTSPVCNKVLKKLSSIITIIMSRETGPLHAAPEEEQEARPTGQGQGGQGRDAALLEVFSQFSSSYRPSLSSPSSRIKNSFAFITIIIMNINKYLQLVWRAKLQYISSTGRLAAWREGLALARGLLAARTSLAVAGRRLHWQTYPKGG